MSFSVRHPLVATTALMLAAGLATAIPAHAEPPFAPIWDHGSGGTRYVALGDSFVSGPGIPEQRPERPACGRSDKNFPTLVATAIGADSFTDASCGAATTEHYWRPQVATGNPAQLDALTSTTTLVTVGTMGGNDAGLVQLATTCMTTGCSHLDPAPHHAAIDALAPIYRTMIADVRERSPRATIVAVGYGTYVPEQTCAALVNATDADLAYLQSMIDRLSDTIAQVARQQRVAFIDMRGIAGWQEHSPCAAPSDQWVRGLNAYGDGFPLHPSTAGMAQMARMALDTIEPLVRQEPLPPQPVPVPRPTSAQRVAAAVESVKVRAVCRGPRAHRRVAVRTTGGKGLVTFASFRVGRQWIGSDRKAPFTASRKVSRLTHRKARGPVRVKVVVRHGRAAAVTTVLTKRPRCLR